MVALLKILLKQDLYVSDVYKSIVFNSTDVVTVFKVAVLKYSQS